MELNAKDKLQNAIFEKKLAGNRKPEQGHDILKSISKSKKGIELFGRAANRIPGWLTVGDFIQR